jgi:dihydrofolate synthase/folylpolyglutamate synthase
LSANLSAGILTTSATLPPPLPDSLDSWLEYIERVHPQNIAMGLDRVCVVKDALALVPTVPVITVGGTNGKGSACMMLEAILHHAGYKVGCYTSPHLMRYNERVRIAREEAGDAQLAQAFEVVERARAQVDVPLTYFEFGTLAAMVLFIEARVDVVILEVGLGGRLDAVNAFEPDCAMLMSVALDHMDYLGDTREKIGFEKAGIFRAGKPAICADNDLPRSVTDHAASIGAQLLVRGRDFDAKPAATQWAYQGFGGARHGLPWPALRGAYQLANAAACIAALDTLRDRWPVTMNDIRSGLLTAENPGRFQVLPGQPTVILDVAHNPHAALALVASLKSMPRGGRTFAVFAMLADKDIAGVAGILKQHIDRWFVAGIPIAGSRGTTAQQLLQQLTAAGISDVVSCESVADACAKAREAAKDNDKILVFGSFHTVSEAMQAIHAGKTRNS